MSVSHVSIDAKPEPPRAEQETGFDTSVPAPLTGYAIHPEDTTNITSTLEPTEHPPAVEQAASNTTVPNPSLEAATQNVNIGSPNIKVPEPPADWEFNNFLSDIASSMDTNELETVKNLFIGEIGQGVLQKVTTFHSLFRVLRNRSFMSKDNLIYLQKCLKAVGRIDLVLKAVDFADRVGNVLHFYPATSQPENGYMYVKFHIKGENFKTYRRDDLDILRARLSKILCVPPEFVLFAGIEPSSSLLITVMIPEEYFEVLEHVLENNLNNEDFEHAGIDLVHTETKTFKIIDNQVSSVDATEEQKKLTTVYQQLQEKCRLLEASELRLLELEQQLAQRSDFMAFESEIRLSPKPANEMLKPREESTALRSCAGKNSNCTRSVSADYTYLRGNKDSKVHISRPLSFEQTSKEAQRINKLKRHDCTLIPTF